MNTQESNLNPINNATESVENASSQTPSEKQKGRKTSFFAKLMCVITAFLLWFYVTGDQNFERTFKNIPVEIEDADALKASGLEAISNTDTLANITVSGKRSVVNSLEASDISAYISLKGISTSQQYMLPIKVTAPTGVTIANAQPESVNVYIDRINLRSVPITAEIVAGGVKDAEPDEIVVKLDVNEVTVEGPNEVVSRIEGAVAQLDLGSVISSSIDVTGEIKLVDANGNTIESEYLSVNPGTVKAHIPVYYSKTVNVVPKFVDGNPEDYSYVISVPKLVLKTEDRRTLEPVESISTKPISLANDVKGKSKYELDIPEGVIVESGISSVEIEISDNSRQTVSLENIMFINLDKKLAVTENDKSVSVNFTGDAAELLNITPSDFYCVADLTKYNKPGEYEVFVTVALSPASGIDAADVHVEGTYKISVTLSEIHAFPDNTPANENVG